MSKFNFLFAAKVLLFTSFMVCFASSTATNLDLTTDQSSLLAFKAHITSDPYNILSHNWSTTTSVCNWIGISCGVRHQRVTALNIPNLGLGGTIAPHLGNLSFLTSLNISYNSFQGNIPEQLAHLHRLKEVDLDKNNLSGHIPSWFGMLSELRYLFLRNNSFTGAIPPSLGNMSNLVDLRLRGNYLHGQIPTEIGNLSNLKRLDFQGNQLSGSTPFIFNITSLEVLAFGHNNLSGPIAEDICNRLPKLIELYLSTNQFSGHLPSNWYRCSKLQILSLSYNKFTGGIPRGIGNLTMLKYLFIGHNALEGAIPQEIGNLLNLEKLQLSENILSGIIPTTIFNITKVQMIAMGSNQLSGGLPSNMGLYLPNLERIYLGSNRLSGILPNSISNASRISQIDISDNIFSGIIPRSLGNLELLEFLNLAGNGFTRDTSSIEELSFITSLANCRQLRELQVSDNPLNGILPVSIGNLSTSLSSMYSYQCGIKGNIPNEIANLTNLVTLSMFQNDLDGYIPSTIKELRHLQLLSLGENRIRGSIPSDLCNLSNMGLLNLEHNELSNSMPPCLGNITSLRYLYLGSNKLSSDIPMSLWRLKDLLELNLSSNSLIGYLPPEIGSLTAVVNLDLSSNQLSGILPTTIGGLLNLKILFLSHNRFEGPIPESIGKLISLELLDLSHNSISGVIPKSLEALLYLQYLNVSYNKLRGEIPNGKQFANFTYECFMSNEDLCGAPRLLVPPCKASSVQGSRKKRALLVVYVLLVIISTMLGLVLAFFFIRRKRTQNVPTHHDLSLGVTHGRISYHELQRATCEFSESNLLGMGSYGSVYRGILANGMNVAIKVFNLQLEGAFKSFDTECEVLRSLRHRNLTKVISSCSNLDFKALVLEYMPNGSLEKWLYSHKYFLNISQRLDIMIDVACALDYLHHGYSIRVAHCDLKPSNVLIDEDMVAHLTDFGIAKLLGEVSIAQTGTLATFGYIAPEFGLEGLVSTRCDVYSYGIMLMEIFTRVKPSDEKFNGDLSLKRWVNDSLPNTIIQVIDANLLNQEDRQLTTKTKVQCVSSVMELALKCSTESPEERMTMRDVVASLQKIRLQFLADFNRT